MTERPDGDVVRFPVERRRPETAIPVLLPGRAKHFSCARCGKSGFVASKVPPEGLIVCGDCGCERWVEDGAA